MNTVVLFGCGALGKRLLKVFENDYSAIDVVGVIDRDENLVGKTLFEAFGNQRFKQIVIYQDLETCLKSLKSPPDGLIHMTESKPSKIESQLKEALEAGLNVISAAESMFFPWLRFPEFAARMHSICLSKNVTLTGTGVNPGFTYDVLPILLARSTSAIESIKIRRCIDVTGTGPGDIEHVGYGLTPEDFRAGLAKGDIVGHMGAPESIALMAEYLDIALDLVTESWDIKTATFDVDSGDATLGILSPGRVVGITQFAEGRINNAVVIETQLAMYYQPENFGLSQSDEIEINGAIPIKMRIEPAVESLFGASHILASSIIPTVSAYPGLINGLHLPLASKRSSRTFSVDHLKTSLPGTLPLLSKI